MCWRAGAVGGIWCGINHGQSVAEAAAELAATTTVDEKPRWWPTTAVCPVPGCCRLIAAVWLFIPFSATLLPVELRRARSDSSSSDSGCFGGL